MIFWYIFTVLDQELSYLMHFIQAFIQSGRPLLLGSGLPESLVNELEERANAELHEARWPQYIRVQNVYARRKHDID